jgi:hypothetical protein
MIVSRLPSTTCDVIQKSDPTSEDRWEIPCDGLEVFTSKGVISSDTVRSISELVQEK